MTKHFCDGCSAEVDPHRTHTITPGYVGEKMLCDVCWDRWKEVVQRFFRLAGAR